MYRDEPRSLEQRVAAIEEQLRQPAGTFIPVAIMDAKGDLVVGLAPEQIVRLAAGSRGSLLTPESEAESGLVWLPPGADAFMLVADSSQTGGLRWQAIPNPFSVVDAKGDLIAASADDIVGRLPVGADGQILYADSGQPLGLRWGDAPVYTPPPPGPSGFGAVQIAFVNESAAISDGDVATIAAACGSQVQYHLAPAFNQLAASVSFYPGGAGSVPTGVWIVHFVDTFDPGAGGWHGADPYPLAHVNVAETLSGGWGAFTSPYGVSIVASHEVCEMFVDPYLTYMAAGPDPFTGVSAAFSLEVGDVAQGGWYSIGGVPMQDFGLPAWWGESPFEAGPYSWIGRAPGAYELPPGAYITFADLGPGQSASGSLLPGVPTGDPDDAPSALPPGHRLQSFDDDTTARVMVNDSGDGVWDYWLKVAEVPGSRKWRRRHGVGMQPLSELNLV